MKHLFLFAVLLLATTRSFALIAPITGSIVVCRGSSTSLSDATSGGTWRSANPSIATVNTAGLVVGMAAGTDSIIYSIGTDSAAVVVTVNPVPNYLYGDSVLCIGNAGYMYEYSYIPGTWSSSNVGIATITADSGRISPIASGEDTIFYTTTAGCVSYRSISVSPAPTPITGPTVVGGLGSTITLSEYMTDGTWWSSNSSVATITSTGIVTGVSIGTVVIYYYAAFTSGCAVTDTISVHSVCSGVPIAGIASINYSICSFNDSLKVLGATNGSDITYQWQSSLDNVSWVNVPGATNTRYKVSDVATLYYRLQVNCTTSGMSAYSNTQLFISNTTNLQTSLVNVDSFCSGINLHIISCYSSIALNISINYGDGITTNYPLALSSSHHYANALHPYSAPGTYSIKEVLYDGILPIDSVTFPYEYFYCRMLPLKIYYDNNNNCIKDSTEAFATLPTTIEIDSNGVAIDTISVLGGIYYKAYGIPGDSYKFKVLNTSPGMSATCTDFVTYTLNAGYYYDTIKSMGLSCTGGSYEYDLKGIATSICGRHMTTGNIYVSNNHCLPQNATVTLTCSNKYNFTSAIPIPDTIIGNILKWNLSSLSSADGTPRHISYRLDHPGAYLTVGDTAQFFCVITPTIGDTDTINNVIIIIDTIKISYDPNEMEVIPQGYILAGAPLQYTIGFENTGNDTAHNIYVMDTLSDNVDPNTLQLLGSSAAMNIAHLIAGGHHILKFDFPNINLLDSSHHGLCNGMVSFSIKTYQGLGDSTSIYNHAGIFFDDNPVVMTDTVKNIVNYISGSDSVCVGDTIILTNSAIGGLWSRSNSNATVLGGVIRGVNAGLDTLYYSVAYGNDTIRVAKAVYVKPLPDGGIITGATNICLGATITLSNAIVGGTWSVSNTNATNTDSVITAIAIGIDTITYTATNVCGNSTTTFIDTIVTYPIAGSITGGDSMCASTTLTLATGTILPMGSSSTWGTSNATTAIVSGGIVTAINAGMDSIYFTVTNVCGADTALHTIGINGIPIAGAIDGLDSVCVGTTVLLVASMPGGIWSIYNNNALQVADSITGNIVGIDTVQYSVSNFCGSDSVIYPIYVKPVLTAGSIHGLDSVCVGSTITLTDTAIGGNWLSTSITIAQVNSSGVVTTLATGGVAIHYTVTSTCGVAMATTTIQVMPLPNAGIITGFDTLCVGSTLTLTDSTTDGLWQSTNTTKAVIGTIELYNCILNGLATGIDTISYTYTNWCGTKDTSFRVVIKDVATTTITIDTSIVCIGILDTLIGNPMGGIWISSDTNATITNGIVHGTTVGIDTITYRYTNICGSTQARKIINIEGTTVDSISGNSNICVVTPHKYDTLYGMPPGGIWTASNINASISTNGYMVGINVGFDTITYTYTKHCGIATTSKTIKINSSHDCDSIYHDEVQPLSLTTANNIAIYPNPTTGFFTIAMPVSGTDVAIEVIDMYGKIVTTMQVKNSNENIQITLNGVASGTYLIKVTTIGNTYRAKLVRL